nr:retrovirus-related Pol polyprotein from transposon TNT 1-94 [Tanacetum cinerariifolium]
MAQTPARNDAQRGNHQLYARMTHPNPQRHVTKTSQNCCHQAPFTTKKEHYRRPSAKPSNFLPTVTTVKAPKVNVVKGVPGNWGNPHHALKDKGVIESGCSRHMIGNMSYLFDFEEINGGYVALGGNPKGGKISDTKYIVLSLEFKLPDENKVLLRVPRENNMYNVDLKYIVLSRGLTYGGFTCLSAKDETSPILKTFITGIENQLSLKVKIIRSDNRTEFKNQDLNQFCGMKGIKREFSVPRTPQQNGIAERKNRTLIEAARTMLVDSLLPILFWAEAVNTPCYVQNRVLVTKPHNKTLNELLHGRTPSIGFMRPFGCHVTILNTLDPLGEFDGKVDEGFLVGYFVSSKAFRVFNSITRIVQETLHINFLENKPNVAGSGLTWLFDIDTLTKKAEEDNVQQYVLFPLWYSGSKDPQNTNGDATFEVKEHEFKVEKPKSKVNVSPSSSAQTKKNDEKTKREAKGKIPAIGQISTNNTNTFSAAGPSNTVVSPTHVKSSYMDPSQYPDDPNMLALEDITYSDDEEDVGAEANTTNLETTITVSPIPTIRVHKDHPVTQIIGDLSIATQTMSMTKMVKDQVIFWDMVFRGERLIRPCSLRRKKVYVDDIIFGSTNKDLCKAFEKLMKDKFQMSSMAEILRKFDLTDGKSASTPIDTKQPLLKDPDGEDVDVHTYRSMIGSLMYLTSSRPDIMFAVIITEATVREALRLNDAESIDYLPNEEIFTELSRMGYEKPSTKLTFYKAYFSAQWKFLIHTILQCMSAKRTSLNEFSSSMALAVICLSTAQVGDLSSHTSKYSSPSLTQKVFANMRKIGKGISGVETPLFEGKIVAQQADNVADEVAVGVDVDDVPAADAEPTLPSPTPTTQPPRPLQELPTTSQVILTLPPSPIAQPSSPSQQQQPSQPIHDTEISLDLLHTLLETCITLTRRIEQLEQDKIAQALEITKLKQRVRKLEKKNKEDASKPGEIIANIDADEDFTLKDVASVTKEIKVEKTAEIKTDANDDELETVELKEVVEVVTTAKLMIEVVTTAAATITAATTPITAATITAAPRMSYDDIRLIFEKYFNSNVAFQEKTKEQLEEEESRALKGTSKSLEEKAAKKQKLDEEVPIVNYEIYSENNKSFYKIIRADESHQLFLSFLSLLRNFNREDLEVLCGPIESGVKHLLGSVVQAMMFPGGSIVESLKNVNGFLAMYTPSDDLIHTDFEQKGVVPEVMLHILEEFVFMLGRHSLDNEIPRMIVCKVGKPWGT